MGKTYGYRQGKVVHLDPSNGRIEVELDDESPTVNLRISTAMDFQLDPEEFRIIPFPLIHSEGERRPEDVEMRTPVVVIMAYNNDWDYSHDPNWTEGMGMPQPIGWGYGDHYLTALRLQQMDPEERARLLKSSITSLMGIT